MSIEVVAFDFGSVLAHPPAPEDFAGLSALAGVEPERFAERYYRHRLDYDHGRVSAGEYWQRVLDRPIVENDLSDRLTRGDVQMWYRFNHGAIEWARTLRGAGIGTAILSNMPAEFEAILARDHRWFHEFPVRIISGLVGMTKPEAEIYARLLEELGPRTPSGVLFLDDLEENVRAARGCGILAEVYTVAGGGLAEIAARYRLPAPPIEAASATS